MTVEADFRALLVADGGVSALVGTRVAQNSAPQGADLPLVVFTSATTHELGLDNTLLATGVTLQVQCWALTAVAADAVADAVQAAVFGAGYVVTDRTSGFDPELELDATMLTVEWWA